MKILLCSVPFSPSIGGIETVSALLAEQFSALGHEVCVATMSAGKASDAPFRLVRQPTFRDMLREIAATDVILHNNISLRFAWPQLLTRTKPWVIAHHVWTPAAGVGRLKHLAMRHAGNIAVSEAIAASLSVPSTVIGNPYADDVFHRRDDIARSRDLVFLGRLVSDKAPGMLIDALLLLRERGLDPSLTIIGSGPEEAALRRRSMDAGLDARIRFAGALRGDALVAALNAHRIMVVPSVWEEPFGIVVLEGLACGLVPVVTNSGGLPQAVGECGLVVPKSDPAALANAIASLLQNEALCSRLLARAPAHLALHTREAAARSYLQVLQSARDRHGAGAMHDRMADQT
jgi:glycogen synthase